jgi:hypothetical protein
MTNTEEWREIPGYEGAYRISDRGHVLSVQRRCRTRNHHGESTRSVPATIMRPFYTGTRLQVNLCLDGVPHTRGVATMVLSAFVGRRPAGHYAEFRNGDRRDCSLANLYWRRQDWGRHGSRLKRLRAETVAAA